MYPIAELTDVDIAFPADVSKLIPPMDEIPEEFHGSGKWNNLFNDWFYNGLVKLDLVPKPGVDLNKALRHIKAVMGSFQPKHEHKEAAVAYLLSEWFVDASWQAKERKL